jgi:PKD repeat protein
MKVIMLPYICIMFIMMLAWFSCNDSSDVNLNYNLNAVFSYSHENADTSTVFTFDDSVSSDEEDASNILLFIWDFEGKQQWTDPFNDHLANYKYSAPGTYLVCLKVIDTEGWLGVSNQSIIV